MRHHWLLAVALFLGSACGKKGPVRPPTPAPTVPIGDFAAARLGDRIALRFTLPDHYPDGRAFVLAGVDVLGQVSAVAMSSTAEVVAEGEGDGADEAALGQRPPLTAAREPGRASTGVAEARPRLAETVAPAVAVPVAPRLNRGDLQTLRRYESKELKELVSEGRVDLLLNVPTHAGELAMAVTIRGTRAHDRGSMSPVRVVTLGVKGEVPETPRVVNLEPGVAVETRGLVDWAVFRRAPAASTFAPVPVAVIGDGAVSWLDTGVAEGSEACYAVASVLSASAYSEPSAEVCVARVDRFPPAAPEQLSALPSADGMLLLWMPSPSRDAAGYRVYRAAPSSDFELLATLAGGQVSYLDATVAPKRNYRYRITTIDGAVPANESLDGAEITEISAGD